MIVKDEVIGYLAVLLAEKQKHIADLEHENAHLKAALMQQRDAPPEPQPDRTGASSYGPPWDSDTRHNPAEGARIAPETERGHDHTDGHHHAGRAHP
jgi:hypothetical protein